MKIEGVIAATVTPFAEGSINYESLRSLLERIVEMGYNGVFPTSSTGEVVKMKTEEKIRVVSLAREIVGNKALLLGGTGTGDHVSTVEIAKAYRDVGVDVLVITPPYYIQYDWGAIYAFYKRVLDKVDMPTILYTIPLSVGYNIPVEVFELVANEYSQVVGVKDSSGDFKYHLELLHLLGKKLSILQGVDVLFVPSLIMGAHGGILGGPNFLGKLPIKIYNLIKEGRINEALEIHEKLMPLWRFMGGCGLAGRLGGKWPTLYKLAAKMAYGIDIGDAREPLPPVDEKDERELRKLLEELRPLV